MIEEIKNKLPNPMDDYQAIAQRVSRMRPKPIAWRTVMMYLNGKEVHLSEGTGALIEEAALEIIRENANASLIFVEQAQAAKVAA